MPEKIVSYKGFDSNWQCRGFQFVVGETYTHEGEVKACASGFHACEYPLDVFRHYPPTSSQFAVVQQSGAVARHTEGSKIASSTLTVSAALDLPGVIKAAIDFTFSRVKPATASTNSGEYGASTNSGEYGASTNSGEYGASTNSGTSGASTNSGTRGASTNSGTSGASTNSGTRGASTNSGRYGASTNSGEYGASTNSGYGGVAADFHGTGRARSSASGAIVCIKRNEDGSIRHIRAGKVGENGVLPDVFYTLDADGDFVEAEEQ